MWAAIVGAALSFASSMKASQAAKEQGDRQAQIADYAAQQQESQAGQELAASQRSALDQRRQANLLVSRAMAVAGAGGGTASDPGVQELVADIGGEGAYRSGVALYQGAERARSLSMGATASRLTGQAQRDAAYDYAKGLQWKAVGNAFSSFGGMYSKFGGGGMSGGGGATSNGWMDAGTPSYSAYG